MKFGEFGGVLTPNKYGEFIVPSPVKSAATPNIFVQQIAEAYNTPVAVAHAPAVNNICIAIIHWYQGVGGFNSTMTVTDSKGNSWTTDALTPNTNDSLISAIARAKMTTPLTTSDTITLTIGNGGSGATVFAVQVLEFVGSQFAATPFDKSAFGHNNNNTLTISTGSTGLLSQAKELCVAGAAHGDPKTATVWTFPAGYTEIPAGVSGNNSDAAYLKVNATTAQSVTFSQTAVSAAMCAALATYKLL